MSQRKRPYRYVVKNWRTYNEALVQRGSLTMWMPADWLSQWEAPREKKRRAPFRYRDATILMMLTLRTVFRLPYRATAGLMRSILELMGASQRVPHYTTLCRRGRRLRVQMHHIAEQARRTGVEVILDGTGMRVDGSGAWREKVYGEGGRREWVKIHVALDGESGMVLSVEVTGSEVADGTVVPEVMAGVKGRVRQVIADGGYDWRKVYEALMKHSAGVKIVIPPRKGAKIWERRRRGVEEHPRDENLRYIRRRGRKRWVEAMGYGRRARVESFFSRMKRIFGESLRSRRRDSQTVEVKLRCAVLNQMRASGMPECVRVS